MLLSWPLARTIFCSKTAVRFSTKRAQQFSCSAITVAMNSDLNNTAAERTRAEIHIDPQYRQSSFAISAHEDDASIRQAYRPFLLDAKHADDDWIARLELSTALKMVAEQVMKSGGNRIKVLVLYGSMRER